MPDRERSKEFWANRYFDDLLVFTRWVPTSQDKFKPFRCEECKVSDLYQGYSKGNKTNFVRQITDVLKTNLNPDWPYRDDLLVQFSVSDNPKRIREIDLDNLAKSILDSLKGTVFKDDSQVMAIAGDKNVIDSHEMLGEQREDGIDHTEMIKKLKSRYIQGFMVAIRRLERDERPLLQDYLFGERPTTSAGLDPHLARATNFVSYEFDDKWVD